MSARGAPAHAGPARMASHLRVGLGFRVAISGKEQRNCFASLIRPHITGRKQKIASALHI